MRKQTQRGKGSYPNYMASILQAVWLKVCVLSYYTASPLIAWLQDKFWRQTH